MIWKLQGPEWPGVRRSVHVAAAAVALLLPWLTGCPAPGPQAEPAHSFGGQVEAERARVEPQLAACGDHVHAAWIQVDEEEGTGRGVWAVSSHDAGRTWQPAVRLDPVAEGEANNSYVRLACRDEAVYAVWWGRSLAGPAYGQKRILLSRSLDAGRAWEEAVAVNRAASGFIPALAAGGDGEVYAAWNDERTGPHTIWFNGSPDRGATWYEDDIRLDSEEERRTRAANALEVQLATGSAGQVFALWQDKATGVALPYFRRSGDQGRTWDDETILTDDLQRFTWPPLIGSDGADGVYLVYSGQNRAEGTRGIYFNRSEDGGRTWMEQTIRIGGLPEARMLRVRSFATDGDRSIWVPWYEKVEGGGDIFLNRSSDGGKTWMEEQVRISTTLPGDYDAGWPVIASDGAGGVAVIWDEEADLGRMVYMRWSADGGATWPEAPIAVSGQAMGQERTSPAVVALATGVFGVMWAESPPGGMDYELKFRRVSLPAGGK